MRLAAVVGFGALAAIGGDAFALDCQVSAQKLVQHVPPVRMQDGTAYCYAFAGALLIETLVCEQRAATGKPCRYGPPGSGNDDRLSVLDFIVSGNSTGLRGYGLVGGGFVEDLLTGIASKGSASRDECAPFDALVNSVPPGFKPKCASVGIEVLRGTPVWNSILLHYYGCLRKLTEADPSCAPRVGREYASELKALLGLQTSVEQIADGLSLRVDGLMLARAVIPQKCQNPSDRVPIPEFTRKITPVKPGNRTSSAVREEIRSGLDQDLESEKPRSVAVNLCLSTPRESERGICGPHVLGVVGKRQVCCGEKCRAEYLVHDSSKTFSQVRESNGTQWVPADAVFERIERFTRFREARGESPVTLVSIAPKAGK